jgi:hypothetical protein
VGFGVLGAKEVLGLKKKCGGWMVSGSRRSRGREMKKKRVFFGVMGA